METWRLINSLSASLYRQFLRASKNARPFCVCMPVVNLSINISTFSQPEAVK